MALELPSVDSEIMKKVNNAIITVLTPKMNFYRNNTECSHEGDNCVIYEVHMKIQKWALKKKIHYQEQTRGKLHFPHKNNKRHKNLKQKLKLGLHNSVMNIK